MTNYHKKPWREAEIARHRWKSFSFSETKHWVVVCEANEVPV